MALDELFKELMRGPKIKTPIIVRLQYKYSFEKDYDESNEILYFDTNINDWVWQSDWCEGQEDVNVMWWVAVDDVRHLSLEFENIKAKINEQIDFNEACCGRTDLHEAINIINSRITELKGE